MALSTYLAKRFLQSILIIFAILLINFIIINSAPGDPARFMGGEVALSSPQYVEAIKERWGLDKPIYERFFIYVYNLLHGDLGYSYRYLQPVSTLIIERLPTTLLLTITSTILAFFIGTFLGLKAVQKVGSRRDVFLTTLMFVFWSIPAFWLGILLIMIFGVQLKWFPISGLVNVREMKTGIWYYLDILYHSVLPITTLTLITIPVYYKLTRDTALQQLTEDYVTTFRAVGLDENRLFKKHVFRNAILPPITIFGLQLGYAIAGAALIETVFGWPGMGRLLLDSIYMRDYPVIMGIYLIISISVVLSNLIVDLVYMLLDPRIRVR